MIKEKSVVKFNVSLPFKFTDNVVLLWSDDDRLILVHSGNPIGSIEGVSSIPEYYKHLKSLGVAYENFVFASQERRDRVVSTMISDGFRRVEFYD